MTPESFVRMAKDMGVTHLGGISVEEYVGLGKPATTKPISNRKLRLQLKNEAKRQRAAEIAARGETR